jgi:hypothetical protein
MGNIYRRFIQTSTGEYIDIEFLIEFGVISQSERAIIWCMDKLGNRHYIDIIDQEWINEYPDYKHSNKIGSGLYKETAEFELKRIMHDILNIDIV